MMHRFKQFTPARWGSAGWLILGGLAVLALWVHSPHAVTIEDETYYLGQAHALARGVLHPSNLDPYPGLDNSLGPIIRYPLIWPLVLAPFVYFKLVFGLWVNAVVHIAGALVFLALLRRRGLPAKYGFLFLLQPALFLYSSTAMADTMAVFLLLMGLWCRENEKNFASGLCWGLMAALRMATLVYGAAFFFVDFWEWKRGRMSGRRLMQWILGYGIAASLAPLSYQLMQGYPLPFYYMGTRGAAWQPSPLFIVQFLLFYAAALLAVYPGMLLGWAWNTTREKTAVAAALLFQSCYFFIDSGRTVFESWVIGQRLILPAVALLLLGYARLWDRLEKRGLSGLWTVFCLGTLLVMGLLGHRLAVYHRQLVTAAHQIDENLPDAAPLHYAPGAIKLVQMLQKPKTYFPDRRLRIDPDPAGIYYLAPNQYLSYRWSVGRPMSPLPSGAQVETEFASLYRVKS